jgi:hypothetical protein
MLNFQLMNIIGIVNEPPPPPPPVVTPTTGADNSINYTASNLTPSTVCIASFSDLHSTVLPILYSSLPLCIKDLERSHPDSSLNIVQKRCAALLFQTETQGSNYLSLTPCKINIANSLVDFGF